MSAEAPGGPRAAAPAEPAQGPRTLVLLHGTNDRADAMAPLARAAARTGRHRPLLVDYGHHRASLRGRTGAGGIGPLADSLAEVVAAVPPGPFDVVGHSQGGLHALGLAAARPADARHVVLLGSPVTGVAPLGRASTLAHTRVLRRVLDTVLGPSARSQVRGSGDLPGDDVHVPGVDYLLVVTAGDRTVPPGPVPGWLPVVRVQDRHPGARVGHDELPRDPRVVAVVLGALAR